MKKNNKHLVGIGLEKLLHSQIYEALQGSVIEEIIKQAVTDDDDSYWRSEMEGHSFKIDEKLLNHYYTICHEVKEKLHFDEPIDFYITGDSSVNAFSVAAEGGKPHIVNLNSAIVELMTDEELKFVIGHELGHLINKDTALLRLINFVFPGGANIPITLQYKIRLWQQLSELTADRYGFLATNNLNVCVSAFFKMASGLDISKIDISIDALLDNNLEHLDYFLNDKGVSLADHPVNPIRIQSLNLFSDLNISEKELEKEMDKLISVLFKVGDSELDSAIAAYIAVAGILVAHADKKASKEEIQTILEHLAPLQIFPKQFLNQILKVGKYDTVFAEAVQTILTLNPGMREDLFCYLITLVLADKKLDPREIDFLYASGENFFGYSRKETATLLAQMIQLTFTPSLEMIC